MDLEEFETVDEGLFTRDTSFGSQQSAAQALAWIDANWYTPTSRYSRWMDLLGDYAGSEPFVIDGHSLIQMVLDDPLLAIASPGDPSFQVLHAIHALERLLNEFVKRSAIFDVVFFDRTRHMTLQTGESQFIVASRTLARRLLFNHLRTLEQVRVYAFEDISDRGWKEYQMMNKPMFVMTHDGGQLNAQALQNIFKAQKVLCQRMFIFDLLSDGLAVTLLPVAEFRDSKILSFVYESKLSLRAGLPAAVVTAAGAAYAALNVRETKGQMFGQLRPLHSSPVRDADADDGTVLKELLNVYLSTNAGGDHSELLHAFVMHCILLKNLSVQDRARRLEDIHPPLTAKLLNTFLPSILQATEMAVASTNSTIDIDGRVYLSLLRCLAENSDVPLQDIVGPDVHQLYGEIITTSNYGRPDYSRLTGQFLPCSMPNPAANPTDTRLLPFSNVVFDGLSTIHVQVEDEGNLEEELSPAAEHFDVGVLFSDTQHWHNHRKAILPKHLGGEAPAPLTDKKRWKKLRDNQRFMKVLQDQAGTLTGALGAALQQIKIPPASTSSSLRNTIKKPSQPRQSGKTAAKPSKADVIRQENAARKIQKQDSDSSVWLRDRIKEMETLRLSYGPLDRHFVALERNPRSKEPLVAIEMKLYRIHLLLHEWVLEADRESVSIRDKYTVSVMRLIKDIRDIEQTTGEILKAVISVLISLGFNDYIDALTVHPPLGDDRRLCFQFIKLVRSKTKAPVHDFMHIQEDPVVWQLRLFGEYMDRSMDSQSDARVAFKPDAWQREVLDAIDQDMSLLVVAPTSAGKTFISYYAMEKVLRNSDDGVLVYIAPTKALVSQIAAEIYARFSKDLHGRSCWAVHTRDYRIHDPQNCQILVTVPEVLAIMLLSPPLAKIWTPRVKCIVLDEIHTIGQQEGGAVWEQILLLAPCPIIGLSATVGAPEKFNQWLGAVQEAGGFKHKFVHHPHRYSHLRKYFYNVHQSSGTRFQSLDTYHSTQRMRFLHPITMLSFGTRSLPSDLSLEASDTWALFNALRSSGDILPDALAALEPSSFFSKNRLLQQKDVIEYEAALKNTLIPMLASFDPRDSTSALSRIIAHLQDDFLSRTPAETLNARPGRKVLRGNLINLVSDLHVQNDLPAILFSFDRTDCEIMATDLLRILQVKEELWREGNAEWKRTVSEWEAWQARAKDRERLAAKAKKQKKDSDAPLPAQDHEWQASFDPEDPMPQFSFAGQHTYSKSDLEGDIKSLGWIFPPLPDWAIPCLKRGIAVHHSGMNKRYRSLVESLFRRGFLRVVFATGTLALGINAPAKTSVFCGDSPYLTALMYRQCAGRAGRRGYDLLGKVVFYGLTMNRVQRLILSKLPSLGANFPITSTLILRLFNVLEGSDYAEAAVKSVQRIFRLPQISFASGEGKDQLLHHLRFSIDYLRRAHLLDGEGKPLNLFGIAGHLYYTEPSNFALVALLRNGVFHRICSQPSLISAKRDFILLMCHLFGRRYLPSSYATNEKLAAIIKKSPSMVVLPALPEDVRQVLEEHDREILRVFTGYALTYGSQYQAQLGPDTRLPLSKRDISGDSTEETSLIRSYLQSTAIPVVARSCFVANSGHGDEFRSVQQLVQTARQGLCLNEHVIPSFEHITTLPLEGDNQVVLNAYLLDFYIHGQTGALAHANGIRRGDVWYLLQEFVLTLKTVRGVLEQLLQKMSKDSIVNEEGTDTFELDSGYASYDPTEMDEGDEGSMVGSRPRGVSDSDWRVYKVANSALEEFEEKYRAMWA
ncbi:P-loop containing nucleoside triphosphate hydrolase protein [Leucogyrophana mollusca]|uniref:P-loop containing nucleoside triphosphate hydrolase protein n=1 Tax=Leucogyrophana mollusca TaxID=85980 RepID=A0ACB8BYN3_9AGAM|nr:P-loop containing nucleoside triphosphate hydrolase protein [Leucogyrophana mollusca]